MRERSDGHWRGSTLLGILAQERQPGDPVDSDDPDDPLGQFLQVSEIQKRVRLRWDQIRAAQLEGGAEALGMGLDAFRVANAQTKLVLTCVSPIPTASTVSDSSPRVSKLDNSDGGLVTERTRSLRPRRMRSARSCVTPSAPAAHSVAAL